MRARSLRISSPGDLISLSQDLCAPCIPYTASCCRCLHNYPTHHISRTLLCQIPHSSLCRPRNASSSAPLMGARYTAQGGTEFPPMTRARECSLAAAQLYCSSRTNANYKKIANNNGKGRAPGSQRRRRRQGSERSRAREAGTGAARGSSRPAERDPGPPPLRPLRVQRCVLSARCSSHREELVTLELRHRIVEALFPTATVFLCFRSSMEARVAGGMCKRENGQ